MNVVLGIHSHFVFKNSKGNATELFRASQLALLGTSFVRYGTLPVGGTFR